MAQASGQAFATCKLGQRVGKCVMIVFEGRRAAHKLIARVAVDTRPIGATRCNSWRDVFPVEIVLKYI
jgi:hypothetical protein